MVTNFWRLYLTENLEKTAMVVTAHPDDAEWGCSASVAKWTRLGWDVIYVLCTDGSKGTEDRSISSQDLANIREKEQRDAGKILGLKAIEFLGYPDGYLEPTLDVRRDISGKFENISLQYLLQLIQTET